MGFFIFGFVKLQKLKKIILLSDTHGFVDQKILKYAAQADEVWHAGDIGTQEVIDQLQKVKPFRAIYGNIDGHTIRKQYPEYLAFECEGLNVLITHIAGYPNRYTAKAKSLIQKFKPELFICGHSHILKVMHDRTFGHLHMNPGAVGISGFHKVRTLLRFEIENGKIKNVEAVELGLRGALTNTVN